MELVDKYSEDQVASPKSSFGVYIAYKIGLYNLTVLDGALRKIVDKHAVNPFIPRNLEVIFENEIIQGKYKLICWKGCTFDLRDEIRPCH